MGDGRGKAHRGGILVAVVLLLAGCIHAPGRPGTADLAGVTGQLEVLRQGQPGWAPAAAGIALAERDEVRAFAGASAEIRLPDASTLFVAENSRVSLARLDVTHEGRARNILLYLPVGKLRVVVAEATLAAVTDGGASFTIATPTTAAVASAVNLVVSFDPATSTTLIACLPVRARPGASPEQCVRDEMDCGRLAAGSGVFDEAAFTRCMRERGFDVRVVR
jgi:hypothetical protein